MKKMAAAAVIAALIGTMALTVNALEQGDVTGTWYGDMMGIPIQMDFNEDGNYTTSVMGQETEGTWEIREDQVVMDPGTAESVLTFNEEDGTMSAKDDASGLDITLGREPVETYTPAEARQDTAEEEFDGTWTAEYVYAMNMMLKSADMGLDLNATVSAGNVTLNSEGMGLAEQSFDLEYADGVYSKSAEQEGVTSYVSLQLLEDGKLQLVFQIGEQEFTFYMSPAEETVTEETGTEVTETEEADEEEAAPEEEAAE